MAEQTLAGAHSHGAGPHAPAHVERFASRDPQAFGIPTGREEEWRFTPLHRLRGLLEPMTPDGKVVNDFRLAPEVSSRQVSNQDPLVGSVLTPTDRISAIAMSTVDHATVVTVPARTVASGPSFLTLRGESGVAYSHLIIEVGEQAEAVIIVDHVGSSVLASNVEYRIADGGKLTVVSLQNWDDNAVQVESQAALLGSNAQFRSVVVTFGGDLVRIKPTVRFDGPGGDAELLGLSFGDSGQHQEHRLFVDHVEQNCRSRVAYKGALQGDDAHSVWIGDVRIRPTAEGTDTYELNRNLLLTDGCRADSVPNLEIETGEVANAGHASATGRFDDEQLFYLMSRGIPEQDARRLVVRGFFADIIGRIGVSEVEERLIAAVEEELAAVGV